MWILPKYEHQLYKSLRRFKIRVSEINKLYGKYNRDKTEALLLAFELYDIEVQIINFRNESFWLRDTNKPKLLKLKNQKLNLKTKSLELNKKERSFKNDNHY